MVEKYKKPPGRPRGFDMEQAIQAARDVFWNKGYDGTSLDDLQEAMGIGRPSLYHAFGDKRSLFLRTLEHYNQNVAAKALGQLRSSSDVHQALRALFCQVASNTYADSRQLGCMVGCVAASVDDPTVKAYLSSSGVAVQQLLETRLQEAVEQGQLPADFPVHSRARRSFELMLGLGFRARSGATLDELLLDAEDCANLITARPVADKN